MSGALLHQQLSRLAANYAWTWSVRAQELLSVIPDAAAGVAPFATLQKVHPDRLATLVADHEFVTAVEAELAALDGLCAAAKPPEIAYFSPEFGLTEVVPQYSGGLGILAGDHLKASSDLRLPLVGVGLFYRQGFFRQALTNGNQVEIYQTCDPTELGFIDTGVTIGVPLAGREADAKVWRLDVGAVGLIVLDTDLDTNPADDRHITDRLYGGDRRRRVRQEMILGVGGARALSALGWNPSVHHLNEGHAGFLILELIDRRITAGASFEEAIAAIGSGLVFTTHTPVPAGIDRFDIELAAEHLQPWAQKWDLPVADLLALGAETPGEGAPAFNMANLCLRVADRANGVSKLHGEVSRTLFAAVPGGPAIGSVTNGVHARTWVHPPLQHRFDSVLGPTWESGGAEVWAGVDRLGDQDIRELRIDGRSVLAQLVSDRTGIELATDVLTIGFARRFAAYKRANLLLRELDRLTALLADDEHPVQFVFAGKAHPSDVPGKALIAELAAFASSPEAHNRFVLVPDYDMAMARTMYAGCDVWLNNPIRPREASGTSGEKSALNGGLNLSISDGWWAEMADDMNGWTIPNAAGTDDASRDSFEATAILDLLEHQIVPMFYAAEVGPSAQWLSRVRHGWRTLGPKVTAGRMVRDYRDQLYVPAGASLGS